MLATHEPCSMCISAITWSSFPVGMGRSCLLAAIPVGMDPSWSLIIAWVLSNSLVCRWCERHALDLLATREGYQELVPPS